jgi:hypothetical protein
MEGDSAPPAAPEHEGTSRCGDVPYRAAASWNPTAGTRAEGKISRQRPSGRRVRYATGRLEYCDDPAVLEWPFPALRAPGPSSGSSP